MTAKTIYLISDSTGELGHRFVNALITQFPGSPIETEQFNFVRDGHDAKNVIAKFSGHGGILFHTVISRRLKNMIARLSQRKNLPCFDLTGPPTEFMAKNLHLKPDWSVGAVHPVNEEYDRRVSAIEFAIEHDDGAGAATLKKADTILVGPSRCSKTPTTMYLAVKGYFVANVPLIREMGLHEDLEALKGDRRVIGFIISPEKLYEVRKKRATELGTAAGQYTNPASIGKEVEWTRTVYRRQGWQTIDVTDRAIEETAAILMRKISKRR